MKIIEAEEVLSQLEGATIVASYIEDEEGLHLVMQDGRVLIIAGAFVLGVHRVERKKLH